MGYTKLRRRETGEPRDDMVRRDADGAFIPADPLNTDWQAYQAWLEAGHLPAAPEPPHVTAAPQNGDRVL